MEKSIPVLVRSQQYELHLKKNYFLTFQNIFKKNVCDYIWLYSTIIKCDALRDLVSFVQFKKREKHPWRSD